MRSAQYHSDTYWIYCTQYLDLHIKTDTREYKRNSRDSLKEVIMHVLYQSSITIFKSMSSPDINRQLLKYNASSLLRSVNIGAVI